MESQVVEIYPYTSCKSQGGSEVVTQAGLTYSQTPNSDTFTIAFNQDLISNGALYIDNVAQFCVYAATLEGDIQVGFAEVKVAVTYTDGDITVVTTLDTLGTTDEMTASDVSFSQVSPADKGAMIVGPSVPVVGGRFAGVSLLSSNTTDETSLGAIVSFIFVALFFVFGISFLIAPQIRHQSLSDGSADDGIIDGKDACKQETAICLKECDEV